MHIVILCGGKGTRLAPLTDHTPKSLIDTRGTPFIHRQLRQWAAFGARRFSLLIGHLGNQIRDAVGHGFDGVPVDYSYTSEPGTWPALHASDPIGSRQFLLTYGDVFPAQRPPPFGEKQLVRIGRAAGVDIGAIWVRSDVLRIDPVSTDLHDLWIALRRAHAVGYYDSLPVHEIGSHEGLRKFNASL